MGTCWVLKYPTNVHLCKRPSVRPYVSCPAHKFVILSRISKLFYINDHYDETTCRVQNLGPYLEGQGHSATLQQSHVRPITLLFEVGFRKYFTEMITILRRHVARNIWVASLKVKVTAWPCSKIVSSLNFVIWSRILQLLLTNYLSNTYSGSITRFQTALVLKNSHKPENKKEVALL